MAECRGPSGPISLAETSKTQLGGSVGVWWALRTISRPRMRPPSILHVNSQMTHSGPQNTEKTFPISTLMLPRVLQKCLGRGTHTLWWFPTSVCWSRVTGGKPHTCPETASERACFSFHCFLGTNSGRARFWKLV